MNKTDNGRGAVEAKIDLRRRVLAAVSPARVFDAFCGDGNMWREVWHEAASYVGCDAKPFRTWEKHRRFCCDNRLVLRSIDLGPFNVFDFDAYGAPWDQMAILATRRRWARGELGGVVLTDGSNQKLRYGELSRAMAQLSGMARKGLPRSEANLDAIQRNMLTAWAKRSNVELLRLFEARGRGSGRGGAKMRYSAAIFRGRG